MGNPQLEWERRVIACHQQGQCEFSGLRVSECVASICDCFETPEGAKDIEDSATKPLVALTFRDETGGV